MNYELAKKLKEAGFPQVRHYGINDYLSEPLPHGDDDKNDFIAIPTLSELIEACPKFLDKKDIVWGGRFTLFAEEKGWVATYRDRAGDSVGNSGEGDYPEEAVANLYLALHKTI